ncbi:filamentous hemagglutinin N-terminal domain-containing protein, partial [Azoarcus indigens]|nr:filamentous hemagglutinin N-terminal domain-containing protein [Azoarcus indigens]
MGRGKAGGCRLSPLALVLSAGLASGGAWAAPAADALPSGGQVVAGQAGIGHSGNTLTVSQGSDKAIIDWQRFDIGRAAAVQFLQPSSSSVALNRVLSGEASQIYGSLTANGKVYLVNPAGVVFGSGSKVDVGALVASTLDISNEDFLAGRLVFSRAGSTGSITNAGEITAADGGLVALLAPTVRNEGVIRARLGTVALAAGDKVTLAAGADGLLQVALEPSTVQTLIENKQLIVADGGQVLMTSKAADALSAGIVANSGTVQARTLAEKEGRILLLADMSHGEVKH